MVALAEGSDEGMERERPRLRLVLETDHEIGVAIRVLNQIDLMGCQLFHASVDAHGKGYRLQLELTSPSERHGATLLARIANYAGVRELGLESGEFP